MKFCSKCGKECVDEAVICTGCGCQFPPMVGGRPITAYAHGDAPSVGFAILSFFIPLLGLILWLIWKDQYPLKAKSCGKGALIGVIVSVAFFVISMIMSAYMASQIMNNYGL